MFDCYSKIIYFIIHIFVTLDSGVILIILCIEECFQMNSHDFSVKYLKHFKDVDGNKNSTKSFLVFEKVRRVENKLCYYCEHAYNKFLV